MIILIYICHIYVICVFRNSGGRKSEGEDIIREKETDGLWIKVEGKRGFHEKRKTKDWSSKANGTIF